MACQGILCIFTQKHTRKHTHAVRGGLHTHMCVRVCVCVIVVSRSEADFLADMSDILRALVQRLWEGERNVLLFTAQWCLLTLPLQSLTHRLLLHITLDVILFPFGYFSSFTWLSRKTPNSIHLPHFCAVCLLQQTPKTHPFVQSCKAVRVSRAKTKAWKKNKTKCYRPQSRHNQSNVHNQADLDLLGITRC